MLRFPRLLLPAVLAATLTSALPADEGMWLLTAPPRAQIKERYGFEVTDPWLEHIRLSSMRFNVGGSGSFVSADGLVITNHHVGFDAIQKLSTEQRNLVRDGFHAKAAGDEMKCVDLELNMLVSIEDVTARVNAAVPEKAEADASNLARRKVMAEIEKESLEKTGFRSDVVTLYQGGAYHLYRYKRFTDVRLVFAPEQTIAAFGGDPDNFEYPRYCLDFSLFRVYEDGKPYKPQHFLKWSKDGAADGELTFVFGNPGNTSRLLTLPELDFVRRLSVPMQKATLKARESLLISWSARSAENARRAKDVLLGIQNGRKVRDGNAAALYDPVFWQAKVKGESDFRSRLAQSPEKFGDALAAFDKIAEAQKRVNEIFPRFRMIEQGVGFASDSFGYARLLLRAAEERAKPNGERLREYGDAGKASFEQRLFSEQPIHEDLEIVLLSDSLQYFAEQFGPDDALVLKVLDGKSPRNRAAELINTTKVRDLAVRKQLYEGGQAAVDAAKDPLIEVARILDPEARSVRKEWESLSETKKQAQGALARARFALEGASNYPDATFTLRLSYGAVKGYEENGQQIPPFSTYAGLYERNTKQNNREPFDLPTIWQKAKTKVNMKTPFNLVTTHDIIGGNSGSPLVNRAGEFVGIIFDGNLQSLSGDYAYDDRQGRALSVHSSGIIEALDKVYGATAIVAELRNGKR